MNKRAAFEDCGLPGVLLAQPKKDSAAIMTMIKPTALLTWNFRRGNGGQRPWFHALLLKHAKMSGAAMSQIAAGVVTESVNQPRLACRERLDVEALDKSLGDLFGEDE